MQDTAEATNLQVALPRGRAPRKEGQMQDAAKRTNSFQKGPKDEQMQDAAQANKLWDVSPRGQASRKDESMQDAAMAPDVLPRGRAPPKGA